MAPGIPVIVIAADTAAAEAVAAALGGRPGRRFDLLAAASPTDALRDERFREARLVLYECPAYDMGARLLLELFPVSSVVAMADPGNESALEAEMDAGASDYVIRDPAGGWLRLLPWKLARLLDAPEDGAERESAGRSIDSVLRLEDSLRRSEIRFGQLVQAIPDVVYHLDPNGIFVFLNDSVNILGYAPRELMGRHFSILIHPEDLPFVSRTQVLRRHREGALEPGPQPKLFDERRSGGRRTKGLGVRLLTKPGGTAAVSQRLGDVVSYGLIEASGRYESGAEDNPKPESFRGTVGIIHDVTLHRRSEEMIRVLLQAVDQSPLPIAVMDSKGTVEYVNPLFLRDYGLAPEHVIGRNVAHLTEDPAVQGLFRVLADTAQRGGEWRGRLPGAESAPLPAWREIYVSPVRDPLGRTTHFIAVLAGGSAVVRA